MNEPNGRLSDGPARRADAWAIGTALFASLWWLVDLALLRSGTPDPLDDIWEYAIAARALLEGEGFRTTMIHPPLWGLRDATGTVPLLIHGPLVPVLMAPLVLALDTSAPEFAAWLSAAFAVLTAILIQRLGAARLSPAVGAAAAALWTLSPLVLRAVHHDLALTVGAALFTAALLLLLEGRPGRSHRARRSGSPGWCARRCCSPRRSSRSRRRAAARCGCSRASR